MKKILPVSGSPRISLKLVKVMFFLQLFTQNQALPFFWNIGGSPSTEFSLTKA